uniref:Uncharacterized protein n=1 Tax=Ditylenchus dipsaci TaxID=166011 RepID=A0A915E0V6_9BILA
MPIFLSIWLASQPKQWKLLAASMTRGLCWLLLLAQPANQPAQAQESDGKRRELLSFSSLLLMLAGCEARWALPIGREILFCLSAKSGCLFGADWIQLHACVCLTSF